ncbi:MAG: phosphatidylglycerophosphatase A [Planctomycetota bacterium]|nr:phosphatidylglycerophosphatase A [Planctomycetota bacterium]
MRDLSQHIRRFLASGAYFGFAPRIPGTFGTIPGVLLFLPLSGQPYVILGLFIILTAVSFPLGDWAEKEWKEKDPQRFVLDEVVGYLLTILFIPVASLWKTAAIGFILFRIFDGLKPPPIRNIQKYKGGVGIVIDDLAAGVCANLVFRLLLWQFPALTT